MIKQHAKIEIDGEFVLLKDILTESELSMVAAGHPITEEMKTLAKGAIEQRNNRNQHKAPATGSSNEDALRQGFVPAKSGD